MAGSEILAIQEVAENQNDKYITINDAIAALESVTQNYLSFTSVGSSDVVLTEDETVRYAIYEVSGASAAVALILQAQNTELAPGKRLFVVRNLDTTYTFTVKTDAMGGDTVDVFAGNSALLQQRGDDIYLVGYFNPVYTGAAPYDIGITVRGTPGASELCLQLTAVRGFRFPDDFAGSDGNTGVNPTSTATFTVKKNGSTIGTVAFNSSGAPTFATSGSGYETFVAGDILRIEAPGSADATMADISITLKGERT